MDDLPAIMKTAKEYQNQGRLDEAEAIYLKILEIDGSNAEAFHLLGLICHARGNFDVAAEAIGSAIIIDPGVAEFHANLSATELSRGQPALANSHARRAIELDSSLDTAHYNYGNSYFALGRTDDALRAFQAALGQDPANDHYWANYLFTLNFAPSATRQFIYEANCRWGESMKGLSDGTSLHRSAGVETMAPARKLKLAYYLPELDKHVTVRFLNAMLPYHDRDRFEVFIYGFRSDGGPAPKFLFENADRWVDVRDQSEESIAGIMRANEINVLLHPCTFKARYRTLLAYLPAPIQIACVNLVSTTGISATTHLITDSYLDPPGKTEKYYTEDLIRLSSFNVYQPPSQAPETASLPARENGFVTFGSFNNPAKMTPQTLSLWAEILIRLPSSRLLLKHRSFDHADVQEAFIRPFREANIDTQRIAFDGFSQENAEYLATYHKVDIGLDPMPFGGGTTTYESIWMGVPVVTCAGDTLMGRLSASLMHRLGLPDYVCDTPDKYVETVLDRSNDVEHLSAVRGALRGMAKETIFNGRQYVAELEEAVQSLWRSASQT